MLNYQRVFLGGLRAKISEVKYLAPGGLGVD